MTLLEQLESYAKERVRKEQKKISLEMVKRCAKTLPKGDFAFERALQKPGISFICECKKASPSKGIIASDFPYIQIAEEYEKAGADCISVLTEPKWFMGSDQYLKEIAEKVSIPCLRKDFIVDEYMIYQAKILGVSAILLICSILEEKQLEEYLEICRELGMSALVEIHDEKEAEMAVRSGARVVGVNNRNLKDFTVDMENSRKLRKWIPKEILFVSESGIKEREDIEKASAIGADGVLIGETLMCAPDRRKKLRELKGKS